MSSTMNNLLNMRNSKKAYAVYAVGIFVLFSIGMVIKNFNDKIVLMTESMHSYQEMVQKQSEQLKAVSMEKERYKRDLKEEKEVNAETIREMEIKVTKLEEDCKEENTKLESEMSDLQDIHNKLEEQNKRLENKYKTLSKANSAAIADIEDLKSENKKLRGELHDASTSKASELMSLRDSLTKMSLERDKSSGQYSALFKQHQQSLDSIQLLQNEKDRLQEQIREIQRLSGQLGVNKNSSPAPEVHQAQPDETQNEVIEMQGSSSTARAPQINQVMEEPGLPQNTSSTSSAPLAAGAPAAAQAPPPFQAGGGAQEVVPLPVQAASRVARYPAQPAKQVIRPVKKKVAQYIQANNNGPYQDHALYPIQPVHHHQHIDNEIDDLQAPQIKQLPYQGNWYPGNIDRHVMPQVKKYGGGQHQLVHPGWADQAVHQQWGGQDNQHLSYGYRGADAGHDSLQRVNRGRDF